MGLQVTSVIDVLGGQWVTNKKVVANHPGETERVREIERRLARLQYVQCKVCVKFDAVSIACLSQLDFINHPSRLPAKSLRSLVKRTLRSPILLQNSFSMGSLSCILTPPPDGP